jgi:hypothetical protein
VAVGSGATILTSPNGVSWTYRKAGPNKLLNAIAWNGDTYVAVGGDETAGIYESSDLVDWTRRDPSGDEPPLSDVTWDGREFLAVGEKGRVLWSADGAAWEAGSTGVSSTLNSVAWTGAVYEAVGDDGVALESIDGRRWNARESGTKNDLFGVVWAGERLFGLGRGGAILDGGCAASPERGTRGVGRP